jgi:hypothetical protein
MQVGKINGELRFGLCCILMKQNTEEIYSMLSGAWKSLQKLETIVSSIEPDYKIFSKAISEF